jgi:hypothetical protein
MKKKVFYAIATMFFVLATVFNLNMLHSNKSGEVSLANLMIMAKAIDGENGPIPLECQAVFLVSYSGTYNGPVTITCTTGSTFTCPLYSGACGKYW